ncbi:hypothetical protein LEMLEM_LOCUS10294 [Lemmus lemmus]
MLRRGPCSYVYMISSPGVGVLGVGTEEEEEEEEEEEAGGDQPPSAAVRRRGSSLLLPSLSLNPSSSSPAAAESPPTPRPGAPTCEEGPAAESCPRPQGRRVLRMQVLPALPVRSGLLRTD